MRYDFDLFYVNNTPDSSGNVSTFYPSGCGQIREKAVLAVFRDQKTIDAVASAPPIVRLFLQEAGFGVKTLHCNDSAHSASRGDPAKRRILVRQLTSTLSNRAMKKALGRVANVGEFIVHDFIASVVSTERPEANVGRDDRAPRGKVMPRRPVEVRKTGARRRVRPI